MSRSNYPALGHFAEDLRTLICWAANQCIAQSEVAMRHTAAGRNTLAQDAKRIARTAAQEAFHAATTLAEVTA